MHRAARAPAAGPDAPLVLGIETATALGGVALAGPAGLLGELTLRGVESHAEHVLPAAVRLFEALGLALDAVAAVAVSCGPGSFTGLRTGIAAAKGLALARAVPLYGVPTLEALAANAAGAEAPIAALVNARRGEFFRALFLPGPGGPVQQGSEHLVPAGEALAGLPPSCLVIGDLPGGAAAATEQRAAGVRVAPPHLRHPRAGVVAAQGLERLVRGEPSELESLLPRYVRPPDARLPPRPPTGAICQR